MVAYLTQVRSMDLQGSDGMDILLDETGDLALTDRGDIQLTSSVRQKIDIKLKWFAGEWRWNEDVGLPYYDDIFVKEPNLEQIEDNLTEAIFEIDEIVDVDGISIEIDSKNRKATVSFTAYTDEETIRKEVTIE